MPLYFSIIVTIFLFDLASKSIVRSQMPLGAEINLLPFFSLTHITNTGVAFGFFKGNNFPLLILGGFLVLGMMAWGVKILKEDKAFGLILALVSGGALGNLYDRMFFGRVTDFLDFYIGVHHWPAFNVADSAICIGAALMIIQNFKRSAS